MGRAGRQTLVIRTILEGLIRTSHGDQVPNIHQQILPTVIHPHAKHRRVTWYVTLPVVAPHPSRISKVCPTRHNAALRSTEGQNADLTFMTAGRFICAQITVI